MSDVFDIKNILKRYLLWRAHLVNLLRNFVAIFSIFTAKLIRILFFLWIQLIKLLFVYTPRNISFQKITQANSIAKMSEKLTTVKNATYIILIAC